MDIKKYEIGKEYKVFEISDFMAHTQVTTFKVLGYQNDKLLIVLKNSNGNYQRKRKLLSLSKESIIFLLRECILKADSETGSFIGNACFNFCNTETEIKEQLKLNLNSDFATDSKFNRVIEKKDEYGDKIHLEVNI